MKKQASNANLAILSFLILVFLMPHPVAYSELQLDESYWDEDRYVFSEHLGEAASWIKVGKNIQKDGVWKKDRFLFPGTATSAEVAEFTYGEEGEAEEKKAEGEKAIRFNTLKGIRRGIEFKDVPAADKLKVSYRIESERKKFEGINYVNFRIWLGKKKLKELRIENDPHQKEFKIPLGIYSFLNREGVFRFEVFSDNETPIIFSFNAELIV